MQYITVGGRQYLKYWHSDDPIMPRQERPAMTPEERAESVLHFLDKYLHVREYVLGSPHVTADDMANLNSARQFLGTALVALVTEARKVDE